MNKDSYRRVMLDQSTVAQLWIMGDDENGYRYVARYSSPEIEDEAGETFVGWHGAVTEARHWFTQLQNKEGRE